MLSKLNTKTLLVLLVILVALFAVMYYSDNTESSYKTELINLDTAAVNRIAIVTAGADTFELVKENNSWLLAENGTKADADVNKIKALLNRMSPLKTMRVAANSKDDWKKFGLADDDKLTVISFYAGNKLLSKLYLGKMNYQAPEADAQNPYMRGNQGIMIGYARTTGDDHVYVVDGYLKLTFAGEAKGYRKKNIIKVDPSGVKEVEIKSGDAAFKIEKKDTGWLVDGQQADSANTQKFINNISRLNGYTFYTPDDIKGVKPVGIATVKTGNEIIKVEAYAVDSVDMALVSSQNKNNIIKDTKRHIFDRLFKEKNYFLGKDK